MAYMEFAKSDQEAPGGRDAKCAPRAWGSARHRGVGEDGYVLLGGDEEEVQPRSSWRSTAH
eukprot:12030819-Heterocapsa_arctica.AAC.1